MKYKKIKIIAIISLCVSLVAISIGVSYYFIKKRSKTPESKTPESKTPESKTPESKTPESKTPESKTPESKTPESKTPESKTPESKTPESKTPESKTPEEIYPIVDVSGPIPVPDPEKGECVGYMSNGTQYPGQLKLNMGTILKEDLKFETILTPHRKEHIQFYGEGWYEKPDEKNEFYCYNKSCFIGDIEKARSGTPTKLSCNHCFDYTSTGGIKNCP